MITPKTVEQWFFMALLETEGSFEAQGLRLVGQIDGKQQKTNAIIGKTPDSTGLVTDSGSVYTLGAPMDALAAKYPGYKDEILKRLPVVDGVSPSAQQEKIYPHGPLDLEL